MVYARKDDMVFGNQACGITDIILIVDCAECTKDILVELRHSNAINGAVYWYDPEGSPSYYSHRSGRQSLSSQGCVGIC